MKALRENRFATAALLATLAVLGSALPSAWSAEPLKAPVPPSPFIRVIYRYADTMIEHGRDTYGLEKTGLFLSALDRATLAPLTNRPPAPRGIREGDRVGSKDSPLAGANLQHDENLLRLLYTLSELSSKPKYREAADAALKWFFNNTASTNTHLLPSGESFSWDTLKDRPISGNAGIDNAHEFFRPWMLWDRCFDLAPQTSERFALAFKPKVNDSSRQAGFQIRTWAAAYTRTKDEQFLKTIEELLQRLENKRRSKTDLVETQGRTSSASVASTLSLAIDCDGSAHLAPEPLASRLRAFAAREDEVFCTLPHDLASTHGFFTAANKQANKPSAQHTSLWTSEDDASTTAQIGLMCVSRYENTAKIAYRALVHAAADAYLDSLPTEEDVWAATLGHAISLELAAWRSTARPIYLDRARQFGNLALEKFFDNSPLPRASLKSNHYETITGADTLALALVELHLHILHITAVRCPPNTIDR